jgi:hypothetical protein
MMTVDWSSASADPARVAEQAWATFEAEARKLGELGRLWEEASTVVRAKDQSLEMTFDGRGELVDLVFNGSKYRKLAPAQLAQVIIETLQMGRAQAQDKMAELMGTPDIPGLDLNGLATGKVKPDEMLNSLIGPIFGGLDSFGVDVNLPRPGDRKREERGDG